MSVRIVGTRIGARIGARIGTDNGSIRSTIHLLTNWNRSNGGNVKRANPPWLPWIHNCINSQHEFSRGSIIRQFSLIPSLHSRRTTATNDYNERPQSHGESQDEKNGKGRGKGPMWTLEEDITLYNYLQKNQQVIDFYHLLPGRTINSISLRARKLRNAYFLSLEKGGLVQDPDMPVDQRVEGLRRIMKQHTFSRLKEEDLYTAKAKSRDLDYIGQQARFSAQEKELLVKLVHKYRNVPEMWTKVSGGRLMDEEGSPRLNRSVQSCKSAWDVMNKDESINGGSWGKYEQQRLENALRSQVSDEYEIRLDLKEEGSDESNQSATASSEPTAKPGLKIRSSVFQGLDWKKIARKVRTRTAKQCRYHFLDAMHNGATGDWTAIETEKLLEGYKLYGRQWGKLSAHIGSRSPKQVRRKYDHIQKTTKK
ncbi:hypothetical protein BGX20_000288 [Mortierella sp. AD010]|nr:hypothetical protein BGX20_000288 [Mortierella sp. AD010]